MSEVPKTPAALFDQLHEWFGIGNYDEIAASKPWHRERMIEIGKLKRMLKSRRASLVEVFIAGEYARAQRKTIHSTWQVFALIPEAMQARFRAAKAERNVATWEALSEAIDEALALGEIDWAQRLMRAEDHTDAIAKWRARR